MSLENKMKMLSNETQEQLKELAKTGVSEKVLDQKIEYASLGGDY